jgi:molybdate transport system ATP-binding protein
LNVPSLAIHLTRRIHASLTLDVQLRLDNECGVVFGPSGAGKSTLLRLIAGLQRPDSGVIQLNGETLFDSARRIHQPLRRRRIGMVFQEDLLFPHRDIASNIGFGLKGWTRSDASSRLREVARLCGVEHLLKRRPSTLSGGERQRVGLARALAPRPRLLLCDEPVTALDLASRQTMLERLREVQSIERIPVLHVTHSPADAIFLGTTLFLLKEGRIVAEGLPLTVLTSSANPPDRFEGIRNIFQGSIVTPNNEAAETRVRLLDGPVVTVPFLARPAGTLVDVELRAEDILLARSPIGGLTARNVIAGVIERVHPHGREAEVIVATSSVRWIVSVVEPAIDAIGLRPGADVFLIFKARSCHVRVAQESPG